MQNKMSDLRNHMFAALERLNDENLSADQMKSEIAKAQAISEIGKVIVDSAKTQVIAMKILHKRGELKSSEINNDAEDEVNAFLERPKAEYSNHSPLKIASAGM
jgi:hypothetical protein